MDAGDYLPLADLIPLADVAKNAPQNVEAQEQLYRWRTNRAPTPQMSNKFKGGLFVDEESLHHLVDAFKAFIDDEMTQLVADEMNLYSLQSDVAKGRIGTTKIKIERLLSIFLTTCIVQMHAPGKNDKAYEKLYKMQSLQTTGHPHCQAA